MTIAAALDGGRRSQNGQFLTPPPVATFMASLFDLDAARDGSTLLDPGAGAGSLTAAFVDRWRRDGDRRLGVTAVEVDRVMHAALHRTLGGVATTGAKTQVIEGDFLGWGVDRLVDDHRESGLFDFVIMNPPYRKVNRDSTERRLPAGLGVEIPNLYAAFVALAVRLLADGGQLVAITPRSFANGPYFRFSLVVRNIVVTVGRRSTSRLAPGLVGRISRRVGHRRPGR